MVVRQIISEKGKLPIFLQDHYLILSQVYLRTFILINSKCNILSNYVACDINGVRRYTKHKKAYLNQLLSDS
jgi:hypothetical protein